MKKQILSLVMILLSMVANAADVVIDGIYYNLSKNEKVATVTYRNDNYNSYSGNVAIPASFTYGGTEYIVTKIGGWAFRDCGNLTAVTIPESVTVIDSGAFQNCTGLTSVTIPNSVTYLGEDAFRSCSSMTSLTIGENVTSIGESAFQYCYNLTTVTIPNSVTIIHTEAFHCCSSLISVTIGSGVKSIADKAFASCPELAVVYCFAKKVPGTNSDMFNKSKIGKATLYVKASLLEQYKAKAPWYDFGTIAPLDYIDGIYYKYNEDDAEVTFRDENYNSYSGKVVIPTSVSAVWGKTYPVKSIGENAFRNCSNLTSLTITDNVQSIGDSAFYNCGSLASVTFGNGVSTIGKSAFQWCSSLTTLTITDNVQSIGDYAFQYCKSLSSVTFGKDVSIIGTGAFDQCSSLLSITLPENLTSIGNIVFRGCSKLTSVSIPQSVKKIGYGAFAQCESLSDVYCAAENIPKTVSNVYDSTPIKKATLHVPNRSIHLYKNSDPWSKFGNFAGLYGSEYTLSYVINGIEYKSYNVWEDEKITPEKEPIKEGYTFGGWSEIPEWMPDHDVTVTGTFTINSYKLIYKVDDEVYKSYEVEYGASITPETAPTKEGYTFRGWSEIPETMPAHDVTVTGIFSINKYKLTYKVDGETYKEYNVEYGATITAEAAPTKEGYTFSGWSEIPETMPAHDVTVTGTFTINKYKLTYIVDGEEYKSYEVEYGATITPETEPTKEGHTFSGWSVIPETMPAHDVTISGTFSKGAYKLIYEVDGKVYKTISYDYGDVITPESDPTKEGYTFSGWSEIPETMPAHDVTVTGSFSINIYKLTYMIDNKVYKEVTYEYGATITPEPQPEGDYQTFEWTDLPQTMPAHDVVVHANYTTGIVEIKMTQGDVHIYSPDGKHRNKLQKGLNIVRMSDGTVKKIVVK